MTTIRPYRLYGESQTRPALEHARQIVDAWLGDWACERGARLSARLQTLHSPLMSQESAFLRVTGLEGDWCAVGLAPEFAAGFYRLMFNLRSPGIGGEYLGVMSTVVEEALADLCFRLLGSDGLVGTLGGHTVTGALPHEAHVPGSGCLTLSVDIAGAETAVWLSRVLVERWVKNVPARTPAVAEQAPTLVSPQHAISGQKVRARVRLGDADLTLGELAVLAVGDVIKLDNGIADQAELAFQDSHTKCLGYLGTSGGNYALRIESVINGKS